MPTLEVVMGKQPSEDDQPKQKTQPKKGEPVEIPVPPKSQVMRDFEKIATVDDDSEEADS